MKYNLISLILFLLVPSFGQSQPQISFDLIYSGYNLPVDIASPDDTSDRLFIVEKRGMIHVIENGVKLSTPFLDISTSVSTNSERGLLGLAFHPCYSSNGFFYTNHTNNSGNTVISRWNVSTLDPNIAEPDSQKVMITIGQPAANHNAGDLNFNPIDDYLYIAMGDGGSAGDPWCNSQDSTSMLGKVLRIDVDQNLYSTPYYAIPDNNPFLSMSNVPNEIWAFGLRNPWKTSFDRKTGDYWIADVGQRMREEVNYIPSGSGSTWNFGWNKMEGSLCYNLPPEDIITPCLITVPSCNNAAYTEPIFEYNRTNSTGGKSITGGFVYRGCDYPGMYGYYICTDFVSQNSWYMDNNGNATQFSGAPADIATFGEDKHGELFAADLSGNIYRIVDGSIPSVLVLGSADFPLSGVYQALDTITIMDPISIGNNTVIFEAPKVILPNAVQLSSLSSIQLAKKECMN